MITSRRLDRIFWWQGLVWILLAVVLITARAAIFWWHEVEDTGEEDSHANHL